VLNLGFVALLVDDLLHAYLNPNDYPFGAENAGWAYRSFDTYLVWSLALLTPLVAGVAALFFARSWMLKLTLGYAPIPFLFLMAPIAAQALE
jgi:hypothetical protein